MSRQISPLLIALLLLTGPVLHADEAAGAAQGRGFKPLWTSVGAGAGFGLGVCAGLTWFDDAINSDRKVWTTAIVSAAIGGVIGVLVDRKQARANPSALAQPGRDARRFAWQHAVYGPSSAAPSLRLPTVAVVTGLDRRPGTAAAPSQ